MDRFKQRETWVLILSNLVGLALATGLIDTDQAQLFSSKGGESIGLLFALISNVAFLISRGIAKSGTQGANQGANQESNQGGAPGSGGQRVG